LRESGIAVHPDIDDPSVPSGRVDQVEAEGFGGEIDRELDRGVGPALDGFAHAELVEG
jgi:hypothetical protein